MVRKGDVIGTVQGEALCATIGGALRGLIHPGITVSRGLKIGDIDPRGKKEFCFTISEKALAIAGGVLEGILRTYGRQQASEKRNQPVASGSGQPDGR
jgi:xanthine dehydrogenase accessory factor